MRETNARPDRRVEGFSLVEVCLAILVVGLGVMVVFGLFPMGLRAVEDASSDTRVSFFAEKCFSDIRRNAATITNYDDWNSFRVPGLLTAGAYQTNTVTAEAFPAPASNALQTNWVRYRLVFLPQAAGSSTVWAASLEAKAGRVWGSNQFDVNDAPIIFYAEFPFYGM